MAELKFPDESTYWIANSADKKTVHYGITDPNQVTTTGQPVFLTYTDKVACETKLKTDLNITTAQLAANPLPDTKITKWIEGIAYKIGMLVLYKELIYNCIKAHTSTIALSPDKSKTQWELRTTKIDVVIIK